MLGKKINAEFPALIPKWKKVVNENNCQRKLARVKLAVYWTRDFFNIF